MNKAIRVARMDVAELSELLALEDLRSQLDAVEQRMVSVITDSRYAPDLVQPGLRVVTGGGKRLRPVLTLASAKLGAPDATLATHAAVAVELVQVGSLVHDDVMDHAASRRGVPTVNKQEGANWAILVGDFLLAIAGIEAARVSADVAAALARTIADLADGQAREVMCEYDVARTTEDYLASIRGKTAALLRCACEVGGLSAGLDGERLAGVGAFGDNFGMAFQIIDDVLDVVATSEALGKPAGNDIPEGVFTLPVLLYRDDHPDRQVRERLSSASNRAVADALLAEIRDAEAVNDALAAAEEFNQAAVEALEVFGDDETAAGLRLLPRRYLEWSLDRVGYSTRSRAISG